MVDTTREIVHDKRSSGISWLALILAILALVLAWLAYNKAGEDLEDRIQRQVNQAIQEVPDVDVDVDPPQSQQNEDDQTEPTDQQNQ